MALKHPGWRRELVELQSLPSWPLRLKLLRENFFPDPRYMEQRFGVTSRPALMLAYLRRQVRGLNRLLRRWSRTR